MRFNKFRLLILVVMLFASAQRSFANDDDVTEDADGNLPPGYVRSVHALNSNGHEEANSIGLEAEFAMHNGHYDQAIKLCQRALAKNDDDADIHLAYADALEHKLHKQKQKDPDLFMAAVREWLIVARNEKGDERGVASKGGFSLPTMQQRYQDEERAVPAMHHLEALVGYGPNLNESDKRYLKRVSKMIDKTVKGKIVEKPSNNSKTQ